MNKFSGILIILSLSLPFGSYSQLLSVSMSQSACINQTILATVSSTPAGTTSYSWSCNPFAPVTFISPGQAKITFNNCGTVYTVVCVALNAQATPISNVLTFCSVACQVLTVTPLTQTICPGASATLNVSGASSYTWNTNQIGSLINPIPSTTSVYSVTGNINGCVATATVKVMNLLISSSFTSACAGNTLLLTGVGGNSYLWTGTSIGNSVLQPTVGAGPGSYTVQSTSNSGVCSNSIIIGLSPPISLTLTQSSGTTCVSQNFPSQLSKPVTLATLSGEPASFVWFPYFPSQPNTGPIITVRPASTTCFTLVASSLSAACNASAVSCVSVVPQFTISTVFNKMQYCRFETVYGWVNAIGPEAVGPATNFVYNWAFTSSNSGLTTASITTAFSLTSTYTTEVTDSQACISAPKVGIIFIATCVPIGITHNVKENEDLVFYPNPTNALLFVMSKNTEYRNCKIEIHDPVGKMVLSGSSAFDTPSAAYAIDLKALSPGIYFVTILHANTSLCRKKIIKE